MKESISSSVNCIPSFSSIDINDSLDLVESLMSMEEKLGIQFTDEEMLSFKTVGDVYTVIEKKLSK